MRTFSPLSIWLAKFSLSTPILPLLVQMYLYPLLACTTLKPLLTVVERTKKKKVNSKWANRYLYCIVGRVKVGYHLHTGERVAIKVISRNLLATSSSMAKCVQRELAVLQLLHHPHLVDLRQVLQDSSNVYFVMEYMEGGELFQVLSERGRLPEEEARSLFRQLTEALSWCHAHHIWQVLFVFVSLCCLRLLTKPLVAIET